MRHLEFGNPASPTLLVQPVGEHELSALEREAALIRELTGEDFCLLALQVDDWNRDLSPWPAPPVFGREAFGGGAAQTLAEVLRQVEGRGSVRCIGGYSLAGLFALWAAGQTDVFAGVAAASPSVWFPGYVDALKSGGIRAGTVCLSLGDREEKTRNPVMATVGDRIRECHSFLLSQGVRCALEWNEGNHFKDPELRMAKAFAWVMGQMRDIQPSG